MITYCIRLSRKTHTSYGTNALDICPGMHSVKLPLGLLASHPLSFLIPFHRVKVVHWEKCMIVPTHHQANEPPAHLRLFTPTWLGLCPLNHDHALVMFLLLSTIIPVTHLLRSYITKTPLRSISRLWFPGLKPSLVTRSPLYVRTVGGNLWLESYNSSSRPEESLIRPPSHIHPSKMVVQRGSTELY